MWSGIASIRLVSDSLNMRASYLSIIYDSVFVIVDNVCCFLRPLFVCAVIKTKLLKISYEFAHDRSHKKGFPFVSTSTFVNLKNDKRRTVVPQRFCSQHRVLGATITQLNL